MREPRRMTGALGVRAATAPDRSRPVATILPNGAQFMLPPVEALAYAFAVLSCARDQFPDKETLDAAVPDAYEHSLGLLTRDRRELQ